MNYILFGSGGYGQSALRLLGTDHVLYFLDNDPNKHLTQVADKTVYCFSNVDSDLLQQLPPDTVIMITIHPSREDEIAEQLTRAGFSSFSRFSSIQKQLILDKIGHRIEYIDIYHKAAAWIRAHTVDQAGIICSTALDSPYPEVTGYFIPSLLRWGFRDLAMQYASWLCSIQKSDGSWYDAADHSAYIFDTAQILKGLLAIRPLMPQADAAIQKGCDWIFSCMEPSGRLITPSTEFWSNNQDLCNEAIHIYCISPLLEAGSVLGRPDYVEKGNRIWAYYKSAYRDRIMNFSLLSHFYAYLMEGLLDLGEREMAQEAMNRLKGFQKESGAVPAYHNCDWVCSTGLFQLAAVWFRLGDLDAGNRAFEYACRLQNDSGGWYGSYLSEENLNECNDYFPCVEISWAVKYYLDAQFEKSKCEFNVRASHFIHDYSDSDGRYQKIKGLVQSAAANKPDCKVLDLGCGKGGYLRGLMRDVPTAQYYGVDISESVLAFMDDLNVDRKIGSMTCIPYPDHTFDLSYVCEALSHAIDVDAAIRELCRVTVPGGTIAILDKNKEELGLMEIEEWEQWFDQEELCDIMRKYCKSVTVEPIDCGDFLNNIFMIWKGTV